MKDLQQIKDDYVKEMGFDNWRNLIFGGIKEVYMDEIATRYANEQKRELVEMLEMVVMDLEERGRAYGDIYTMSKDLITKHKQATEG